MKKTGDQGSSMMRNLAICIIMLIVRKGHDLMVRLGGTRKLEIWST